MTIGNWLQSAKQKLKNSDVISYLLDTQILLEHVTNKHKAQLLAHDDIILTNAQIKKLDNLLSKRVQRIPIAYLVESKEFYGRNFYVDERVLVPRPESESFIELVKELNISKATVLDVGCGSGILGITIKLEQPSYVVTLSDNSEAALEVAKINIAQLDANVKLIKQDLFGSNLNTYDVIVANLPYVPEQLEVQPELGFEPAEALYSDNDGLDHYQHFWQQIPKAKPQFVLTESLELQHEAIENLAKAAGYSLSVSSGLVQCFKKT